jgi:putative transcriptional regulator
MQSVTIESKTVICNLQKFMKDRDLNITQLSKAIQVTQNTIRGYFRNRFDRIDCEVAIKLCNYFDVSFGEMFEIVEE